MIHTETDRGIKNPSFGYFFVPFLLKWRAGALRRSKSIKNFTGKQWKKRKMLVLCTDYRGLWQYTPPFEN